MKPATIALALCLADSAITAPTSDPSSDVVRRSASWFRPGNTAGFTREQIEQISKDIKSNLTSSVELISKVSKEEPLVKAQFLSFIAVVESIKRRIEGSLKVLASLKGKGKGTA